MYLVVVERRQQSWLFDIRRPNGQLYFVRRQLRERNCIAFHRYFLDIIVLFPFGDLFSEINNV